MNHTLNSFGLILKRHCSIILLAAMGYGTISCTHFNNIFHKTNTSYQQTHTKDSLLGQTLPDLAFFPINGTRFRLSEFKNIKAIVIIMRDVSCPISNKYGHLIAPIEQKYASKGVQFIYNYVGQKAPEKNAEKDLKKFNFKGLYVIDTRQKIINALGANTTGEVFVLTPERQLIYKGPLHGTPSPLKAPGHKANNHYVSDVLKAVISNEEIIPKELEAPGKLISRPVVKKQVYFKDVVPIIREKCTSCHNPEGTGLMNFISYEDIAGRGAMFKYVVEKDLMPPWYVDPNTGPFRDDISLTLKEKALLLRWADLGFPVKERGRKLSLWSKSNNTDVLKREADYVISLPEKVVVPAEGASFYKRFVIQTPFKEDKWIKDFRFVVKPKVVHHFDIYIMDASYHYDKDHPNFDYMAHAINYVANLARFKNTTVDMQKYHKHIGVRLPRLSKLVLELHYETVGQEVLDNYTQVYFNFHKKKPKYETALYAYDKRHINIPPHTSNYKTEISYVTKKRVSLAGLHTHMHLRGKASSISVTDPKGIKKRIFGIDPFTKTFERTYIFKKPLSVPKGSVVKCVNWFDNSENNPSNPDPKKHLIYGPSIEDEMSICFFKWLIPVKKDRSKYMFWKVLD